MATEPALDSLTERAAPRTASAGTVGRSALPVRRAYDLSAPFYDDWHWQAFWQRNEWPIVGDLVAQFASRTDVPRLVLDLGAGTGRYLGWLARDLESDWRTVGLDLSGGMLTVARRRLGPTSALVQADVRSLPFADRSAGIVMMNRVGSHLADLHGVAAEVARVMAPGGHCVISDIAPEHGYVATELPLNGDKIPVTTVKHAIADWTAVAAESGLTGVAEEVLTAGNIRWLPTVRFRSIDRTDMSPIAFILAFRKFA